MSECNCCCAYLSPPWWVTMGYAPPVRFQGQSSQQTSTPGASNTSTRASSSTAGSTSGPTSRGTIVEPPPARVLPSVRPIPLPAAAGDITRTIAQMAQLL
jgi:hypothetical protein